MRIHFYVRFHTKFGQSLAISGNAAELGNNNEEKALALEYLNAEYWQAVVELDPAVQPRIQYKYMLLNADGYRIVEGGNDRELDISKTGADRMQVIDTWNHAGEFENVFYTDPFQEVLLKKNETRSKARSPKKFTHIFKVKAPLLKKNEVLCIGGADAALGEWAPDAVQLLGRDKNWWSLKLSIPREAFPLHYKYGIYNTKSRQFTGFESGDNRTLYASEDAGITLVHDGFARFANNSWKGAGIAIPVFSLRSKNSFGTGEFTDLKLLVDWAKKTGSQLIQILPVNDTTATGTWQDSYPYAAISAFALHPLYINIQAVAGKEYADLIKPLRKKQRQLNELPELDYEQVMKFKIATLKELFLLMKTDFLKDEGFLEFFERNRYWLIPYAAFCYLRDRNGTSDFNQWKLYGSYDKAAIEKYVSPRARHYSEIAFTYFLQYQLHLQLKEAADYAHQNGIILKGDIPIGIYRYGCDAWMEPDLYHMDMQAGAPPDDFALHGQNWGFPTYNWEQMARDGFEWWHRRFVQMGTYFDAFRIDHILGFFRIWSIPVYSVEGIMGHFVPASAVHIDEFAQHQISFQHYRLCAPYINDTVLWEAFGPNNRKFIPFLRPLGDGYYEIKPEFSTQALVEAHFAALEDSDENQHIRQGLFDLLANVILFEEPGSEGKRYHFRFNMEKTSSFRYLDEAQQELLRWLYTDYYFRRQDDFWRKEAMNKLPALKRATNMLICGEDLGLVPSCVPDVMNQLGILSLEIQRMPKTLGHEFFHPADAPYLSVVTPSTHDMSTIRGWWEEDPAKTQRFYNSELGQWGEAPAHCEPWINKAVVLQHLYSPAIWSIFQLQDLLGMDGEIRRADPAEERINVPANPRNYWRYRMHITLEELLKEKSFNEALAGYIEASGRA